MPPHNDIKGKEWGRQTTGWRLWARLKLTTQAHACLNPVVSARTPRLGLASTSRLALVSTTNRMIIYKFYQKAQYSSIKQKICLSRNNLNQHLYLQKQYDEEERQLKVSLEKCVYKNQDSMWFFCFKQTIHVQKESQSVFSAKLIVISKWREENSWP